ncbi:solute carrier family 22 member 15-like [Patiria miniata]|uniref:Major facilitator superfamily (MFS) profile domain-containing protein n=1 Tax=Patiria miniata TaxID=46514 RepID=A0A913ZI03_PATMI|nr:solute carrier family 22 member 15-like [Patiria miniata]
MKLDFDDALEKVGGFGFIQRIHFLLLFLMQFFQTPFIVLLAFVGKEPTFICKGRRGQRPCKLTPPCKEYLYSKNFTSIVSEWDLVCEHKADAGYAQSVLMFGYLIGVVAIGRVSDKFGRRRTFFWGTIALVVIQLVSAFTQDIYQYAFTRFWGGFFYGGAGLAGYILMLEGLLPKKSALFSSVFNCSCSLSLLYLAAMAYFVRDWRQLTLVTSIPMASIIIVPLVIPESARWLASQGRRTEAEDQLLGFSRKNGVRPCPTAITLNDKREDTKGKTSAGTLDLFRTPVLRRRMIILMITWFSCCLAYYGLTFGASSLGGSMYVNFALSGFVEIPANLISVYALNWIGRRSTTAGSLFVAGFACLAVMSLHKSDGGTMSSTQTCLALIGKMGISIAFNSIYLYSAELLPTVLRNTGVGVCSMSARLGGVIAPTLLPFGEKVAYLVFGLIALLSALLDLTLPESLNKQLPETVMDVENSMSVPTPHPEKAMLPAGDQDGVMS